MQIARSLRQMADWLESDGAKISKKRPDWTCKLLEGESSTIESTYLLYLPPNTVEPQHKEPAIIPFEVLNTEWRAWWNTFTASLAPEQEKPSELAEMLKG